MDRRKFLSSLIGSVAAAAAVRTFPFRVFSFPKEVKPITAQQLYIALQLEAFRKQMPDLIKSDQHFYDALRYVNFDGHRFSPSVSIICTSVDPITNALTWKPL